MNKLNAAILMSLLGLSHSSLAATLYLIDSGADDGSSSLQSIDDITTGTPTKIGETGMILTDLAWHPTAETLIAIDYFSRLYRVDPETARLTLVGELGYKLYALEFCGDSLYAWGDTKLVQIDPSTAKSTVVGDVGFRASGDLACSDDGSLYGTGNGYDEDLLIRISRNTGKGTQIGVLEYAQVLGLDFDADGTLFGVSGVGSTPFFSLSPYTAMTLQTFPVQAGSEATYGMTIRTQDGTGCSLTDKPTQWFYPDEDGDGYGSGSAVQGCQQTSGYSVLSSDCNDTNSASHPGAAEVCDGVDNDCDGLIDEGASNLQQCYPDADSDGYGVGSSVSACTCPRGYTATAGDCLDSSAQTHPGAQEQCNARDDDCDGQTDEGLSTLTLFRDADGDLFGGPQTLQSCSSTLSGYTSANDDCNDSDTQVHPGAEEICNGLDDNCNGLADESLSTSVYYVDADGDGAGDPEQPVSFCGIYGDGISTAASDCNDQSAAVYPGAPEQCNDLDDDCDGTIDDDASDAPIWYPDRDFDGYGSSGGQTQVTCDSPGQGWSSIPGDCDDGASAIHPGKDEVDDGLDNDCDGLADEGLDEETPTLGPEQTSSPSEPETPEMVTPTPGDDAPGSPEPEEGDEPAAGCSCSHRPADPQSAGMVGLCVLLLLGARTRSSRRH